MKISQNIRYYREKIEMSEYTLARLIDVDVSRVNAWEKGTQKPDASELHFIACALNIDDGVLTDPGPLPEKPPKKEEIKHDHAAFDGGVLGQPEGIYGSSKPKPDRDREKYENDQSTVKKPEPIAVSAGKTGSGAPASGQQSVKSPSSGLSAAENAKLHPVFASDVAAAQKQTQPAGEYVVWSGKPGKAAGNKTPLLLFTFIFAVIMLLVFIGTLSDGDASVFSLIVAIVLLFVFSKIKNNEQTEAEIVKNTVYQVTDRRILIKSSKEDLSVDFDTIKSVRIVNEQQNTKTGTIIFDVYGKEKITTVPKIAEMPLISVFYNIGDVRTVFQKINAAYRNYQKTK